jgi:hypothetical protein
MKIIKFMYRKYKRKLGKKKNGCMLYLIEYIAKIYGKNMYVQFTVFCMYSFLLLRKFHPFIFKKKKKFKHRNMYSLKNRRWKKCSQWKNGKHCKARRYLYFFVTNIGTDRSKFFYFLFPIITNLSILLVCFSLFLFCMR